jgi:hypothetical protein
LLERGHEFENYKFPAPPVSSPAGRLNTSGPIFIRWKVIESAPILGAAIVPKIILAGDE